jgi:DnaJ-class molecular chaperone
MHVRRVKDVDDLALVECLSCAGTGKNRDRDSRDRATCPYCHGTGDRVIHRAKYYEVRVYSRRDRRRGLRVGREA